MANTKDYQDAIVEATRVDDDIKLVEAILEYFSAVENVTFLPLKRIKSFFVAARSTDSEAWKDLSDKEALAVENILAWTGHSPNTIAVVLRTYERSTPELRQAQQDGRLSRYPAESISRLYKGTLKDLQPRLIEMYLRYGITNEDLRKLVPPVP